MQVQSINNHSARQLNFEGKFNIRNKYMIDTDLIKNFVSSDRGVMLNLKERVLHSMPTERQMNEYRYTCQNIIKENSVTHMPKKYNSAGMPVGWNDYDHVSEHAVVPTPERAKSMIELYKNQFWSEFGIEQLEINIPYESFVNTYKEAIKPENATKIYNLV